MFDRLPKSNRKKMFLNTFLYYPLSIVVGLSVTIFLLKYVGLMEEVPLWYVAIMLVIGIGTSIHHLIRIYRDLSEEGKR